jgi:hypothetical protein
LSGEEAIMLEVSYFKNCFLIGFGSGGAGSSFQARSPIEVNDDRFLSCDNRLLLLGE